MRDVVLPPENQEDVIRFLSSSSTYGLTAPVERHVTHGSIVFLCGDRAYKLKRAVLYPYMDYSTAERRREMCERELAVNRRTAPSLYLDVRPIVRDAAEQLAFGSHADDRAVDWVVVMRRFSQQALLETMRKRQELPLALMPRLAEQIAVFHQQAEIRSGFGGGKGIGDVIAGDVEVFHTMAGHPFLPQNLERLARLAWRRLDRDCELLDQRRDAGFVRRCHGDLHLNNICLIDGQPVPFDAIEFSERFSSIDVFYDLAFLLMDLDRHGLHEHANAVLNRYLEKTGDYDGLTALPLFLSCRAAIRAHVTVSAAHASSQAPEGALYREAEALLDQAIGYLVPAAPRLIAVGGLSGTGKSTLARSIAPALGMAPGAIVVRSDVIRKQICGPPMTV
jgi:aminoglycoside phosphotransferase family enzyme